MVRTGARTRGGRGGGAWRSPSPGARDYCEVASGAYEFVAAFALPETLREAREPAAASR